MASITRFGRSILTGAAIASVAITASVATPVGATPRAPGPDAHWGAEPPVAIHGGYQALVGDLDGDLDDDVFWYAGGVGDEYLWLGEAGGPIGGAFRSVPAPQVRGDYTPLVGNFAGDRSDDIFWYGWGDAPDVLWVMSFGRHRPGRQQSYVVNGSYLPFVLDDTVGKDAIVWYDPDESATRIWTFTQDGINSVTTYVPRNAEAVVGDFDANGRMDIFWYPQQYYVDKITWRTSSSSARSVNKDTLGHYRIVAGHFDDDATWDLWFQPDRSRPGLTDPDTSQIWYGGEGGDRTFTVAHEDTDGGRPLVLPHDTAIADDLLIFDSDGGDVVRTRTGSVVTLGPTGNTPLDTWPAQYLVGHFTGRPDADLLVYGDSGFRPDQLFLARPPLA